MADDRDARIAQLEADVAQRDRALAEAREQQTATAEILRIIASSPIRAVSPSSTRWPSARFGCAAPTSARVYLVDGDVPTHGHSRGRVR